MNSKFIAILLGLLAIISLMITPILAQDDEPPKQTETKKPTKKSELKETLPAEVQLISSPDVLTSIVFPSTNLIERTFKIGEIVDLIFCFTNNGDRMINITSVIASFRYPQDWRYYIQDFTRKSYGSLVAPGEFASFVYKFKPDAMLEPREFTFTAAVFYTDSAIQNFTSVLFNSTINMIEAGQGMDAQTLFTYIGLLGVLGLGAFVAYKNLGKSLGKKKSRVKIETGTQATGLMDEWLVGTSAESLSPRSKSPTGKKTKKA